MTKARFQWPLTPSQVAAALHVSTTTLRNWRKAGVGPIFETRADGRVVYLSGSVELCLAHREAQQAAKATPSGIVPNG